jgi:hypothetical protein
MDLSFKQMEDEEKACLVEEGENVAIIRRSSLGHRKKKAFARVAAAVAVFCVLATLLHYNISTPTEVGGPIRKDGTLAMNSTYQHKSDNSTTDGSNNAEKATVNETSVVVATETVATLQQNVESTVATEDPMKPVTETPVVIVDTEATPIAVSSTSSTPGVLPRLTREQLLNPIDLASNYHQPVEYGQDDLSKISVLKKRFAEGRAEVVKKLKIDYGEYYESIFLPGGKSIGRSALASPHWQVFKKDVQYMTGYKYFVQKMKLKLVQAQLKFLETENPTTTLTRFVHAHGGHR